MRDNLRRTAATARWFGRALRQLALLFVGMALVLAISGCQTNAPKTPEEARKELEEKLKKQEKPKEPFARVQIVTEPNEKVAVLLPPAPPPSPTDKLTPPKEPKDEVGVITRVIKPGHWTGVLLTTMANNFDFTGDLVSTARDARQAEIDLPNSAFRLSTSRAAPLAKGQPKTLETLYFAPAAPDRTSSWMANQFINPRRGSEEYRGTELFQHMPAYQYYLVVLAGEPARYKYLNVLDSVVPPIPIPLTVVEDQHHYRVLTPRPQAPLPLPSNPLAWSSVAYLLWDDVLPGVLSPEQQQAVVDWLHWGGGLIISGPRTLDSLRGSFLEPYLPATAAATATLDAEAFGELNVGFTIEDADGGSTPLAPERPLAGVKFAPHPQAHFVHGTGELVVERRVGRGRVVATAFRLSERELLRWPSFDSFLNACLLGRPPRQFNPVQRSVQFASRDGEVVLDMFDPAAVTKVRYFSRDAGVVATLPPFLLEEPTAPVQNPPATPPTTGLVDWEQAERLEKSKDSPGVAAWNDFNVVAAAARGTLREAAGISVPKREFVFQMIGLYLLLVVVANWIVFKLLGRVEWAWIAVPVLAIGWGVVVVWSAQLDIGFARAENEVAIVELQNNYSRGHLTRYLALYTSLSTTYDVELAEPTALAQPLSLDRDVSPGQGRSTANFRLGSPLHLDDFPVASNATGMLHVEQMVDLGGALVWDAPADGPATVKNQTRVALSGVAIMRRLPDDSGGTPIIEAAWVGSLAPGKQATVTFKPRADVRGKIQTGRDESPVSARRRADGVLNVRRVLEAAEESEQLSPGDVRLVGWYDGGFGGVAPDPAAAQSRRATVVVANLQYSDLPPAPDRNLKVRPVEPEP